MQHLRARWIALLACAVGALLLVAFRAPLFRATVAALLDVATGSRVAFASLEIGRDRLRLEGLTVRRNGDPLLEAERIDVGYDVRDLFPGGKRRFGLRSIDVLRPHLSLMRHADGSFDLPAGGGGGAPAAPPAPGGETPLVLNGTLRDGRIDVVDPARVDPAARRLRLDAVDAQFAVDTAARTTYRVRAAYDGEPLTLAGTIDAPRRYALHRLRAARLPIATLLNYVINYRGAHVLGGSVVALDAFAYTLGASGAHFGGSTELRDGAMTIPGLRVPLRGMAGRFDLFDDGVASGRIAANEAGLAVEAAGGIFDWQAPAFRLGFQTGGPLETLRTLFNFSHALPLSGNVAVGGVVEGPVGQPFLRVRYSSARVAYGRFPLEDVAGSLVYYDSSLALLGTAARYGPFDSVTRGSLDLGDRALSQLVLDGRAPPASVPFIAQAVPLVPLRVTAVLAGSDLAIDARGIADGAAGDESARGLFRLDRNGDGEFGPFALIQGGGSADGAFYANRSSAQSGFWLDARRFTVRPDRADPQLPGLPNLVPPDFAGTLDARLAGEGHPSDFRLAGEVGLEALTVGRYRIGNVGAQVAGAPADLRAASVVAAGPWGGFRGIGAYTPAGLALSGRYRGSLEQLAAFTGNLGAKGPLDAPVALVLAAGQTIVQSTGASLPGGSVRGVPVSDVRGTVAVGGKSLRVFAATARVAGGSFAAAGSVGGSGRLGVALGDADAARLRALGSPLERGRIAALGTVRERDGAPGFDGTISLAGAEAGKLSLAGSSGVDLNGGRLDLHGGQAVVDGNYARFEGRLEGVGRGPAALDLALSTADVRVAPFARLLVPSRHDIAGTFGAQLRIGGSSAAPSLAGRVAFSEGTFQGQAFRDASADIALDRAGLSASDGTIAVGSTRVAFAGDYRPGNLSARLSAPQADLSDFDDLFDTGDTLDGRGRLQADFVRRGRLLATSADVEFAGLRYLRFNLGDSSARWSSRGRDVTGTLVFGAAAGQVLAEGSVRLAGRAPLPALLRHSRFNGYATLRNFDLSTWLPLLGYTLPLAGRVDAEARITGSLASPELALSAALAAGSYGKIPIRQLALQATANLQTLRLTAATLDLGTLQATGSGTVGLGLHDPLALSIHATSSDLAGLGTRLTGAKLALTGSGEADVKLTGSRLRPAVAGGFYVHDATFQSVAIPQVLGQFRLEGRSVELESAELVLAKGRLNLAGAIPFTFSPFGFGPPGAPVAVEVGAEGLDLSNFAPLLPKESTIQGLLEGRVGVSGSAGAPRVEGRLTLTNGAVTVPAFETEPLTKIGASLGFDRNTATLERFHAEAGGGSLDANGRATLGLGSAFLFDAVAHGLRLDLPAYGRGTLDGSLKLARQAGGTPALSGKLELQDTVIPFSALTIAAAGGGDSGAVPGFVGPQAPAGAASPPPARPDLSLALDVAAVRNVRVRSGNVDIGGTGALHVGGTLDAPQLSGELDSTGGTLSYFNTVFRVQSGKVTFEPSQGLIPELDAVATTHVSNPDPNGFRNVSGSADVTITVKGPVTQLDIQLSSTPSYSREQILGLLLGAPSLGANLFDTNGYPAGTISRNPNGQNTIGQQAFNIANAQFTKNLLAPFETQAAGALGLTDINVNVDMTGAVGVTARKGLGKFINAIYSQTFGYPTRQSFGFEIKPNQYTAAQVTAFETVGAQNVFNAYPALLYGTPQTARITAAQPIGGTSGFAFSLQLRLP